MKDLIVVAQARQYDSFGEQFIEVINLLCNLGPHFVPVVNLPVLGGEAVSHEISEQQNHINLLSWFQ